MTLTAQRFFAGALAVCILALASPASADTVTTTTGGTFTGAILKIEGGRLQMQSSSGNATERAMDTIAKIQADGEKDLNEAEEAFAAGKFDVAAAAYDRTLSNTKKDWAKERSINRLLIAAEKANQFPLSAAAFAQVASRDPLAGDKKPAIPADKAQIAKAIPLVERVFNTKQTELVRAFLVELYIGNEQLDKANALIAAAGTSKSPALVVMQAKAALAAKNYAGAMTAIEQNRTIITQADQQLDALWVLAESKYALAGTDPAKKTDAALAYMRVASHFAERRDGRIIDALMKTAGILETTGQSAEAGALYAQIAIDPRAKGTPVEAAAKAKADALKNAKPPAK